MTLRRKAIDFDQHFAQLIDMLNGIYSFSSKQQQIKGMTMYQYVFSLIKFPGPFILTFVCVLIELCMICVLLSQDLLQIDYLRVLQSTLMHILLMNARYKPPPHIFYAEKKTNNLKDDVNS